jgi:curved DNA-binding protein CbpA
MEDLYALLGVEPGASTAKLRSAYRRRSREVHPDRSPASDATARMAALNAAYAVLGDPVRRAEYDRACRVRQPAPRPVGRVPASGRGAPQPGRLPDWYAFLGLPRGTDPAVVLAAARGLGDEVRRANYPAADEAVLLRQLRMAVETLSDPRRRAIYDDAIEGVPPPAGEYAHLHRDWYSFLGVRPGASAERLAERATELSARIPRRSAEYRELEAAWKVLRDPAARARYDRELAEAGAAVS